MENWYAFYIAESRRREAERATAEAYRLAHSGAAPKPAFTRFIYRLLAQFGALMVEWGCLLQQRYEKMIKPENATGVSEC